MALAYAPADVIRNVIAKLAGATELVGRQVQVNDILNQFFQALGPVGRIIFSVLASLAAFGLINKKEKEIVLLDNKKDCHKTKMVPLPIHIQHKYEHEYANGHSHGGHGHGGGWRRRRK